MQDFMKRFFIIYTAVCVLSTLIILTTYGVSGTGEIKALWLIYVLVITLYKVLRYLFTGKL